MRLIDADALSVKFDGHIVAVWKNDLDAAPTIDAEPVVRCKECKCWDLEHISCEGYARCLTGEIGVRYRKENDFCSRGERRSNNK